MAALRLSGLRRQGLSGMGRAGDQAARGAAFIAPLVCGHVEKEKAP
jgi:hypothetical protein